MLKSTLSLITKVSVLSVLIGASVGVSISIAATPPQQIAQRSSSSVIREPKNQAIDRYTNHFFYAANPQLQKRKLLRRDSFYIGEWNTIRQAIAPLVKSSHDACVFGKRNGDAYWEFDLTSKSGDSYNDLTDVIYYYRNPQMAGLKLQANTDSAREWSALRQKMYIRTCGI